MRRRVSSSLLLLTVGLSVVSCHVGPTSKSSRSRGDSLLARRDYAGAQSQFERAVSLSSTPQQKARALIGLGRSQLRAGRPEAALKTFHAARKASSDPSLRGASDRWIGEAQLDVGNFGIALRYFRKGLRGMKGETRQRTLAYISFCYRESGDKATAAKYRKKLNYPLSNDIAAIVDGKSRRLVAAKKRVRDQTPKRLATNTSRRQSTPKQTTRPRTKPRPRRAQRPMVIHDRREWQARRAKSNVSPMNRVTRLTIHHSAGDSFWEHSQQATADHIRKIQRFHQREKGWADIGYHFIVDRTGTIWEGRELALQGAHAGGSANRGNIGIVVLGNYTRQNLNRNQVNQLNRLVAYLADRYGIPPYRVHTHKELQPGHTACPGPALNRCVQGIRQHLRRRGGLAMDGLGK